MFDQIRFFPVSETVLDDMRSMFKHGALDVQIEKQMFNIAEYNRFVITIRHHSMVNTTYS